MAIPLLFYFSSTAKNRAIRWLLWVFIAFGLIAVLSSWSRGGLIALGGYIVGTRVHKWKKSKIANCSRRRDRRSRRLYAGGLA